jgi:Tol biopolymer transport system component
MLVIGLAGGWALARSPVVERVSSAVPDVIGQPINAPVVQPPPNVSDLSLGVFDRGGKMLRTLPANRPWTPRLSPDGRFVAYGAYGEARESSDLWVTDLEKGTTRRLTDDDGDSNDPQWSADGGAIAYSASAPGGKDVMLRKLGGGEGRVLAARSGTQFPNDWLRDGALLVSEQAGDNRYDILIQPKDGSTPRPYAATAADETAARISPDGRWVAYTSDESGRAEVYLDAYPRPGRRMKLSNGGGLHPVWRADGRELYYWNGDQLTSVQLEPSKGAEPPTVESRSVLFTAPYALGLNTMYDVSRDGQKFVIVARTAELRP